MTRCFCRLSLEPSSGAAPTRRRGAELQTLGDGYAGLSHREREVMALVVAGLLNKQIAGDSASAKSP